MAGWGAMMGLGNALQQVGGMIGDYNKSKMRERLEVEREQRAHARELERDALKEAKRLSTPKSWKPIEVNGQWHMQGVNADGTDLDWTRRPMDSYELETHMREQRAAENRERLDELTLNAKEFEARNLEEKWRMEQERHRSALNRDAAAASASRARARGSAQSAAEMPEESQVVSDIIKELGSYGDTVPKVELDRIVMQALEHSRKSARDRGIEVDPVAYARILIQNKYGEDSGDMFGQKLPDNIVEGSIEHENYLRRQRLQNWR